MKKVQFTFEDDLHKYFKMSASSYEETMQEAVSNLVKIYSFYSMKTDEQENYVFEIKKRLEKEKILSSVFLDLFKIYPLEKEEEDLVYKSFDCIWDEKIIGNIYLTTNSEAVYIRYFDENFYLEDEHVIKKLCFKYEEEKNEIM